MLGNVAAYGRNQLALEGPSEWLPHETVSQIPHAAVDRGAETRVAIRRSTTLRLDQRASRIGARLIRKIVTDAIIAY